ncbi:hypothetical protein CBR_g29909 [Chara braunii]|uniref:Uncharacterized protein n=1 Tax=Chara braunii TaxID=69332 RepID=A0A388JWY1_CHABU|nr:hypothetical protein CBR_g29909 [Chara braunii]|eukprot:GBG62299.1 hypothetical protein CBR_g29909 [Chara braunii]
MEIFGICFRISAVGWMAGGLICTLMVGIERGAEVAYSAELCNTGYGRGRPPVLAILADADGGGLLLRHYLPSAGRYHSGCVVRNGAEECYVQQTGMWPSAMTLPSLRRKIPFGSCSRKQD